MRQCKTRPKSILKPGVLLIGLLQITATKLLVECNPIAFNHHAMPLIAIPPGAYHPSTAFGPNSMVMAASGHLQPYATDPYASMMAPFFVPASAYGASPWPMQPDMSADASTSRRSVSGGLFGGIGGGAKGERASFGQRDNKHNNKEAEPSDEQKALDGLPLSFIEPDPPSSISERISESFSALNEGVKNHFRSISENFSDTIDDIRDAWRPAPPGSETNESRKRRS